MIAGNGMNVPETVMGRQSYMHWCWILLLILAVGNEWNMHGTRARLLGLIRERDRTDDVAFVSGSKLLLTLRATYTPAVCGGFVLCLPR